jgi:dipeptidyl aminopeptidase/acylaminoacyl peptidase
MSPFQRLCTRVWLVTAVLIPASALSAQQQQGDASWSPKEVLARESYTKPPAEIEKLVTAPRQNNVSLSNQSPDRKYFLKLQSEGMPSVQSFGKPHLYFAGLQVDAKANRARTLTTRGAAGLSLIDASTGVSRELDIPKGATVSAPAWSPNGSQLAYIANFDASSNLYVADVATGKSRKLGMTPLLATLVSTIDWTEDGRSLVAVLLPTPRGAEPVRPGIETGPQVRMTQGKKISTRNYASLLMDPFDKAQMEYYVTGQLAMIDVKTGRVSKIGAPSMISAVDMSPDGKAFRVTLLQKPFSYIVPETSFGTQEELWDASGKRVAVLSKRGLSETEAGDAPAGGRGGAAADTARRNFGWMPNGTGLYFLQQDAGAAGRTAGDTSAVSAASGAVMGVNNGMTGGPPAAGRGGRGAAVAGAHKDHLYEWLPPFDATSRKEILASDSRLGGVIFSDDGRMVFAAENVNGTGALIAVALDDVSKHYTIWRQRATTASVGAPVRGAGGGGGGRGGADDSLSFYQSPGALMTKRGHTGNPVALVSTDGRYVYLEGTRYNKNWQTAAPRTFVDKVEIRTGQKAPVFEGATDVFETVAAPLDDDFTKAVVVRESPTAIPDSYLRDLKTGTIKKLTNNKDYAPEFTNAIRKRILITRVDGFKFYVNITLPQDYKTGTRLPAMFWF